ncbi:MAG TPA: nucleotidyltransferase [Virgibacillus sp.]|nr:nucleotidyltransferase [Virgibacillus sp.]
MKACGLIVEYNPLHNGHLYHIEEAKSISQADCMIAVMSGSFLQRGEPAIIDKFHRAEAALASGIDIIIELPYPYAVQSSRLFAKGSVHSLSELGVSSICFGSESGDISNFTSSYCLLKENEAIYTGLLKEYLSAGLSFPLASMKALEFIGLTTGQMDLSQPNNILGFSYVKTILDNHLPIKPFTIKRTNNEYHEQEISSSIASATSIRRELILQNQITKNITDTLPQPTRKLLNDYKQTANLWHTWEDYFPLLHYRVMTISVHELSLIEGVDEGIEGRIKQTAKQATSFKQWMGEMKTKRYTWTRLQRMFIHILTNTKKADMKQVLSTNEVPYIRILGLTNTGQAYVKEQKKEMEIPIITQMSRDLPPMLEIEEKASQAYYSILSPTKRIQLQRQEIQPPILR